MKKIITTIAIIMSLQVMAQEKTVTVSELRLGYTNLKKQHKINLETNDTTTYTYISYKNEKYRTITDIQVIIFDDLQQFRNDLESSIDNIRSNVNWSRDKYNIICYDFTSEIYLYSKRSKYVSLTKKQAIKIIDWIDKLK